MSCPTIKDDALEEALEILCEKLIAAGAMSKEDKTAAVEGVAKALRNTYPDGIPQDLFTDPAKRKNLMAGLVSVPLMEKYPELNLKSNLELFFNPDLKPHQTKALFKTFLMELNKLEPDPNKRRSEKEIDAQVDKILDNTHSLNQDSKPASDPVEEIFKILYGVTSSGERVVQTINKGNMGFIDSDSVTTLGGGSKHEGRGLSGDTTTDPVVDAKAKERLQLISGVNEEEFRELKGIVYTSPTLKIPGSR
jgi:hypothetical protein